MIKRPKLILLSGEIASGKSSLAQLLETNHQFTIIKTSDILKNTIKRNKSPNRIDLQKFGEKMDKETSGDWIVQESQEIINSEIDKGRGIIIDSVRIRDQIKSFRRSYGYSVFHVHLLANSNDIKSRYLKRPEANKNYELIKSNNTESKVNELRKIADLVINTSIFKTKEDSYIFAASSMNLLSNTKSKNVDAIIGGQFGSEGKGQIAAYLAPEYDCLVRVGGPNAGHKVFAKPLPYTFHLLPSGTLNSKNAKLILAPGAVINEDTLLKEITRFNISTDRLLIDENATIINTKNIRDEEKLSKIGSTKKGVGAATANNLFQHRLNAITKHKAKESKKLKGFIGCTHQAIEKQIKRGNKILLEGTQGSNLSIYHGMYPFVTSRDTNIAGCLSESGISPYRLNKLVLVTRRYPIRVKDPENGTSGGFGSDELTFEEISQRSGIPIKEIEKTEKGSVSLKTRRIAEFNWTLFRKTISINCPTDIAFTFSDYISIKNQDARRFNQLTSETIEFIEMLEQFSGVPVSLIATGFGFRSIIDRRKWR